MNIKQSENYFVDVYIEPHKIDDHTKIYEKRLEFTGLELIRGIISAGMPNVYLTKSARPDRKEEIAFKIKMFETFVRSINGALAFDQDKKKYLDSTEVGAINYWIGMILITVLGQKEYHYEFMVHLSMIQLFSSKISINKKSYFSANGKICFKSPDLLAVNHSLTQYGVFESKGYWTYSKKAVESGYIQAKSIKKINGSKPAHSLVVLTQTGDRKILMIKKDPAGEGVELNVDPDVLFLYHFLPIVELIGELEPENQNNRMTGTWMHHGEKYRISLPMGLYERLSRPIEQKSDWLNKISEPYSLAEMCREQKELLRIEV